MEKQHSQCIYTATYDYFLYIISIPNRYGEQASSPIRQKWKPGTEWSRYTFHYAPAASLRLSNSRVSSTITNNIRNREELSSAQYIQIITFVFSYNHSVCALRNVKLFSLHFVRASFSFLFFLYNLLVSLPLIFLSCYPIICCNLPSAFQCLLEKQHFSMSSLSFESMHLTYSPQHNLFKMNYFKQKITQLINTHTVFTFESRPPVKRFPTSAPDLLIFLARASIETFQCVFHAFINKTRYNLRFLLRIQLFQTRWNSHTDISFASNLTKTKFDQIH